MAELKHLGRYEILSRIGSGSYANVYRAWDMVLDQIVALKVLKPALIADDDAVRRFIREGQTAAGFLNDHIANVLNFGEEDGYFFMAMRYVEGKSLDQKIKERGNIPWKEALQITCQVGDALAYVHGKEFVHCDVKPENILVSSTGGAVLTDFGLVCAIASSSEGTRSGSILGTHEYIAAEIWDGEPATYAIDQCALACVLFEMLSGEVLYGGTTPWEIVKRKSRSINLREGLPKGLPIGLEAVLEKALNEDPEKRYGNIEEFLTELKGLGAAAEEVHVSPGPGGRGKTFLGVLILVGIFVMIGFLCLGNVVINALLATFTSVVTNSTYAPTNWSQNTSEATSTQEAPVAKVSGNPSSTPATGSVTSKKWAKDGMVLVYVPEGEFLMGSNFGNPDETPLHTVYLDAYWIDKSEVTNAMYAQCVAGTECDQSTYPDENRFNGEKQPVVGVDWNMAKAYCKWAGRRLPSEAEWEKAARGKDGRSYPWGVSAPDSQLLNYNNYVGKTKNVGSYAGGASPYGALDMAGNVWEWVNDWYAEKYYSDPNASRNPTGPSTGKYRVGRGGSLVNPSNGIRSALRYRGNPSDSDDVNGGFRCALSATP